MKSRNVSRGPLTDQQIDAALRAERDAIAPSSGFAESVMGAVRSEAPAPLPFPWKRALPGFVAGAAALCGFAGAGIWILRHLPASSGTAAGMDVHALMVVVHRAATPDAAWALAALAAPLLVFWLTQRIFTASW